ncbi:nuclear pore complex protein Nup107-like [Physella acuta]|uniref:nuclear pore complex protein Nup107-like n=1 Tax=Physella acuta TaxID=109671 RepID=UPI0027DDC387|nr:nuclear pore complex protein Nup107-like [Physella acuta]
MDRVGPSFESFLQQGDTPVPRAKETATALKRRSTNLNLQKSIKLLDDAVTPYVNRSIRTPRGSLRHSTHTPARQSSGLDASDLFNFTPTQKITPLQSPALELTSQHLTQQQTPGRQFQNANLTTGLDTTEFTNINLTLIADEDPGKKASTGMYGAFKEILKQLTSPHQVMDLLTEYESYCAEQVSCLKHLSRSVTRNQPKFKRTMDTFELLQHEKNTWKLIRSLYKDRLETEAREESFDMSDSEDTSSKAVVWSLSENNIANRLFEKDALVRQSQLVIDWLETCASEHLETYYKNVKFFVDQPVSWENTLHHLQKLKQGHRNVSDRYINEMDPDAPLRLKKSLDDLDQEDDRFFIQNLFIFIRAGQLEKAQELCHACGQPWRAATLEGWRLLHDSNYYVSSLTSEVAPVEGNPYRDIWKAVCWRMASEKDLDQFERAVYATLSGNLHGMLPVCASWMDYVWAYFKVMVDVKVEQEIRLHRHIDRQFEQLPPEYFEKNYEPSEIFKEINASNDENVRLQAENWYHIIQKFIILNDISGLIEVMHGWLDKDDEATPGHLLRLMAHIILFLRTIGRACKDDQCEAILKAYVRHLIKNKQKNLVAHYVAALSPSAQVHLYASFLEDIESQDERQQCLIWAEEENLDVALITKTVVEKIRSRETVSLFPETSLVADLNITEEDKAKIDAIEWLVFDPSHRSEAVKQANAMMRTFIAVKKHAAARQVFEKLPSDTIDVILRSWYTRTSSSELPANVNNAIREYMCMKAYLDAVESFNDWFSLYHQGQPVKPSGVEGGSFTDRVAFDHRMKQYQQEYERWMHNLQVQTRTTRDRIYNVLLFTDGGWLVDTWQDEDADVSRQEQMSRLRKLHLPALCLNLHKVLDSSQMYVEAVQLADIIASEQHQLYKEFDKESLQHILTQIMKSAHSLLDDNKDPLGYQVV